MPVRGCDGAQPIGCHRGDGVQGRTQRLGEQLDPVQVAHGGQHVRAVGALAPVRFQQPAFARGVEQALQQAPAGFVFEQPAPELTQDGEVEPGVGQLQREQVFPVDPAPHGVGRLPVAQPFAELQERDQSQAPGRIRRLAQLGVEVGEARIVEHGAEPVAQEHVWVAAPERGPGDAGCVVGHGRDGLLRAERHGRSPSGSPTLYRPASQLADFANGILTFQDWALASRLENVAGRLAMRHFRRKSPRVLKDRGLAVCPGCLRNDAEPYVHRAWTLGWVAVCPDHQVALLSRCPSCRRKLKLPGLATHARFAPERCWGCGYEVSTAEMPAASQHSMRMQAVLLECKRHGTAPFFGMGAVDWSLAMTVVDAVLGAFWSNDDAGIQKRLLRRIGKDVGLAALRPSEADGHAGLAMLAWFLEDWPERGHMLGPRSNPALVKTFLPNLGDIDNKTRRRLFNLLVRPPYVRVHYAAPDPRRTWLSMLDPVELGFQAAQEPLQWRRDRLLVIAEMAEGKKRAAIARERRISDRAIKDWLRIGTQHGLQAMLQVRVRKEFAAE